MYSFLQYKDEVKEKIARVDVEEGRLLFGNEHDEIFQSIVGPKPNYVCGWGYMVKPPTTVQCVHDELNGDTEIWKGK